MSMWSKPNRQRQASALNTRPFESVGQPLVWRRYISASAGNAFAGEGETEFYRESVITAFMGQYVPPQIRQSPTMAGMIAAGAFYAVSREPLGVNDELVWNSAHFRVEGSATRMQMTQNWIVEIKKALP